MGAADDPEDYVIYGTPLEREDELGPRKRKLALEKGQARRVAPWQQEVTDSEGRRRFHGAFTGGFSAGYYNTAGSKEGWTPATFSSSRKQRADFKEKTAFDFMDEDEKTELNEKAIGASSDFDTFGFTAAEIARRQAALEVGQRPSIIPGPTPDEIVVPLVQSIGVKLLTKMGWRHGRAIGPKHLAAAPGSRRQARKAMIALAKPEQAEASEKVNQRESSLQLAGSGSDSEAVDAQDEHHGIPSCTPVFVLHPKNNKHGLGFDPYKLAPEFRDAKRARNGQEHAGLSRSWGQTGLSSGKPSLFRPNAGKMSGGFGIGALEELGEEDEDVYATGFDYEIREHEIDPPSSVPDLKKKVHQKSGDGVLPSFKLATASVFQMQWFPPPRLPSNFVKTHKFTAPLHIENVLNVPEPITVPAPDDKDQCKMIEGLANFVARCGQKFEDLCRERNMGSSQFSFLFGGPGHDYYVRKLWEERQKLAKSETDTVQKISRPSRLDAEQRGRILNEVALPSKPVPVTSMIAPEDRDRLQAVLLSTFTKSGSEGGVMAPAARPFLHDPAKQARYEQYLKDKTMGGLRFMDDGGKGLTEVQRAQEILEFENAARGSLVPTDSAKKPLSLAGPNMESLVGDRFMPAGADNGSVSHGVTPGLSSAEFPRREEHTWRPMSLLCKRFDIADPYIGKAPPPPRPRSRTESLILVSSHPGMDTKPESGAGNIAVPDNMRVSSKNNGLTSTGSTAIVEVEEPVIDTITEKPVDLFKAIFSDSEDDDIEPVALPLERKGKNMEEEHRSAAEAAHSALNRLVAGDFLESLGKELGLKVPAPVERRQVQEGGPGGKSVGKSARQEPVTATKDSKTEGVTPTALSSERSKESSRHSRSKDRTHGRHRKKDKELKDGVQEQGEKKKHHRKHSRKKHKRSPTPSSSTSTMS